MPLIRNAYGRWLWNPTPEEERKARRLAAPIGNEDVTLIVPPVSGQVFSTGEPNIPQPYPRPGAWSTTRNIADLPSIAGGTGASAGPSRTVMPQKLRRQPLFPLLAQRTRTLLGQIASRR